MLQSAAKPNNIVPILKSIRFTLDAVLKGVESGSALGGMSGDHDALQNVFIIFKMITVSFQSGNMKEVGSLLQQLQYLINGLREFLFLVFRVHCASANERSVQMYLK